MRRIYTAIAIIALGSNFIGAGKAFADEAFNRGVQLYKAGQYAEAVSSFEQSKNKSDPVLHYYLGNSLGYLNRTNEALAEYTTCSLLHPDANTSDLCNQALKRYSQLPESAARTAAPGSNASSETGNRTPGSEPHKPSALEWANDSGTQNAASSHHKPSALEWANDSGSQTAASGHHKLSALEWANDSGAPAATNPPSPKRTAPNSTHQAFDQRIQDQLAAEKAQLEAQREKAKQALERATQEASEIKKDAHTQTEELNAYGHKGVYYHEQMIEEIKEDAALRSKDIIERGRTESQLYAKSADEKQRALDAAVRNLHAQMRGGKGKVRLDPTDSNLYVRNYKSH